MISEEQLSILLSKLTPKEDPTFHEFSVKYLTTYAQAKKRSWKKDMQYLNRSILPTFGNKRLSEITAEHIQAWFNKASNHPTQANRMLEVMSKVFTCATAWGYFVGQNPCQAIKRNQELPRERWLNKEEITNLQAVLNQEPLPIRAIFTAYLLTGCRHSELRYAKWNQVDLEKQELLLARTKNGRPRRVYLPDELISLLSGLPRASEYVFAGQKPRSTIDVDKHWCRIRERAGLPDVRVHDLRHTFGSHLAQAGINSKLLSELLGHRDPKMTARYSHFADEDRADAIAKLSERYHH